MTISLGQADCCVKFHLSMVQERDIVVALKGAGGMRRTYCDGTTVVLLARLAIKENRARLKNGPWNARCICGRSRSTARRGVVGSTRPRDRTMPGKLKNG